MDQHKSDSLFFHEIVGRCYRYADGIGLTTNHGKRRSVMPVEYREDTDTLMIAVSYTDSWMEVMAVRADKYCREFFTETIKPF